MAYGPVPMAERELAEPRRPGRGGPSTKGVARPVTMPDPDPAWHPLALELYESLGKSGGADYYQQSDWVFAKIICEYLSGQLALAPVRRGAQIAQTILSSLDRLLVTEADRRRVRLELLAPESDAPTAAVIAIAEYREALGLCEVVDGAPEL